MVLVLYLLKMVKRMWFNQEDVRAAFERFATGVAETVDARANEELAAKREAERKILDDGKGICLHCGEVIHHNPTMANGGWTWESEDMLGWCDKNTKGGHKHTPKIEIVRIGEN
jgi:hypothetical protein